MWLRATAHITTATAVTRTATRRARAMTTAAAAAAQPAVKEKIKIIIIAGPTGIGKSALALQLVLQQQQQQQAAGNHSFQPALVSADAVQVYERLNIGSNKHSDTAMRGVKQHCVDITSIREGIDVGTWYTHAQKAITEIHEQNNSNHSDDAMTTMPEITPVVVGGSGFYLSWLLYGPVTAPRSTADSKERARQLCAKINANELSWSSLMDQICSDNAARVYLQRVLDGNNGTRTERAVEILLQNEGREPLEHGKALTMSAAAETSAAETASSDSAPAAVVTVTIDDSNIDASATVASVAAAAVAAHQHNHGHPQHRVNLEYDVRAFYLYPSKKSWLQSVCEYRCELMLQQGLINEVLQLLMSNSNSSCDNSDSKNAQSNGCYKLVDSDSDAVLDSSNINSSQSRSKSSSSSSSITSTLSSLAIGYRQTISFVQRLKLLTEQHQQKLLNAAEYCKHNVIVNSPQGSRSQNIDKNNSSSSSSSSSNSSSQSSNGDTLHMSHQLLRYQQQLYTDHNNSRVTLFRSFLSDFQAATRHYVRRQGTWFRAGDAYDFVSVDVDHESEGLQREHAAAKSRSGSNKVPAGQGKKSQAKQQSLPALLSQGQAGWTDRLQQRSLDKQQQQQQQEESHRVQKQLLNVSITSLEKLQSYVHHQSSMSYADYQQHVNSSSEQQRKQMERERSKSSQEKEVKSHVSVNLIYNNDTVILTLLDQLQLPLSLLSLPSSSTLKAGEEKNIASTSAAAAAIAGNMSAEAAATASTKLIENSNGNRDNNNSNNSNNNYHNNNISSNSNSHQNHEYFTAISSEIDLLNNDVSTASQQQQKKKKIEQQ